MNKFLIAYMILAVLYFAVGFYGGWVMKKIHYNKNSDPISDPILEEVVKQSYYMGLSQEYIRQYILGNLSDKQFWGLIDKMCAMEVSEKIVRYSFDAFYSNISLALSMKTISEKEHEKLKIEGEKLETDVLEKIKGAR